MTILVVDDQSSVVEGIIQGVNWKALKISKIYKAYNAFDARQIIRNNKIDILLCDIEMPGESGLQLFKWIREEKITLECIFLTAHADFEFAREAVRLGGFDYILQPARYEEIQNAVIRAKQKIYLDLETSEYSSYGKILYQKKEVLLNGILRSWLCEEGTAAKDIKKDLMQFQIHFKEESRLFCILIQVFRKSEKSLQLDPELLRYMLFNVLEELFAPFGLKVLLTGVEAEEFALLLYEDSKQIPQGREIRETLLKFTEKLREFFGMDAACYGSEPVETDEAPAVFSKLKDYKNENVSQVSRIFWGKEIEHPPDLMKLPEDKSNWHHALAGGNARRVREEAYCFLDQNNISAQSLRIFYREFMQSVSEASAQLGISTYQIFSDKDSLHKSLAAYQSVETMKDLIDAVTEFFENREGQDEINYIETVIQYINCNIEKDIRRSELAAVVNLNEDYLSRLFKKEKGISLKEFILLEKMKMARILLSTTNFSIGTVAIRVGFTNFSHFSQMYKKSMGVNPAEERRPGKKSE